MRGGYRKGAGRKKGFAARNAEEARKVLSAMLIREIEPIGEALIARAKEGEITAARELFDRAWGKAPQSIALHTMDKPPMTDDFLKDPRIAEAVRNYENEIKKAITTYSPNQITA